jgi:hypothetical protein
VGRREELTCIGENGALVGQHGPPNLGLCPQVATLQTGCRLVSSSSVYLCCGDHGRLRCQGSGVLRDLESAQEPFGNVVFERPMNVATIWTGGSAFCALDTDGLHCWGDIGLPSPSGMQRWNGETPSFFRRGMDLVLLHRRICFRSTHGVLCSGPILSDNIGTGEFSGFSLLPPSP